MSGCLFLEFQLQADAGAGINQERDPQGKIGFVLEVGDTLAYPVLVDMKSVLTQIRDKPVLSIRHGYQDVDRFHLDPNRRLLERAQKPERAAEESTEPTHLTQFTIFTFTKQFCDNTRDHG